jgi:ectoine hydroxylase-related dioxygenase (phytanoyl-CoA dioxygenase family)
LATASLPGAGFLPNVLRRRSHYALALICPGVAEMIELPREPIHPSERPTLAMTAADEFEQDGAVCLRGVLKPELVELLRRGIDDNIAHPSPRAKLASRPDDPGRFVEDFCNWRDNRSYRRFIAESGLGEISARLMGSSTSRLYHDHMLTKEAGTQQPTPWHQDQPYYNIEGWQTCSFWIPVDPISRSATLKFVAGSHKGPWLMPRSFMDAQAKWFPEGSLQPLPDVDARHEDYRILGWDLEPGDLIVFHMLTLHASGGADRRRRVFSVRFMGDDVIHAPRRWATSPQFPGLDEQLPAGAPMEHPLFPMVWPKPDPVFLRDAD